MAPQRCALIVDSEAGLAENINQGLAVVPLRIALNGELSNGLDAEATQRIYQRLRQGDAATTSTPSPGDFLAAFRRLDGAYSHLICLTIPGKWSGMLEAARIAAKIFAEENGAPAIEVVETATAAAGLGLVTEFISRLCVAGASPSEVMAQLQTACRQVRMFGALATLEFVARSGRVPGMIAGIGNALHVRPVFEMHNGETGRLGLARTEHGVVRSLVKAAHDRFGSEPIWLKLFHADAEELLPPLAQGLQETCNIVRQEIVALSPVIGLHIGPGAIGFAALPMRENSL